MNSIASAPAIPARVFAAVRDEHARPAVVGITTARATNDRGPTRRLLEDTSTSVSTPPSALSISDISYSVSLSGNSRSPAASRTSRSPACSDRSRSPAVSESSRSPVVSELSGCDSAAGSVVPRFLEEETRVNRSLKGGRQHLEDFENDRNSDRLRKNKSCGARKSTTAGKANSGVGAREHSKSRRQVTVAEILRAFCFLPLFTRSCEYQRADLDFALRCPHFGVRPPVGVPNSLAAGSPRAWTPGDGVGARGVRRK